ncbi:MAG: hypothetical protein PVJ21_11805, partial [Anaerolineales bacterium]
FDTTNGIMSGFAPHGSSLYVVAATGPDEAEQTSVWVQADEGTGYWFADFSVLGLTDSMRGWSFAQVHDDDGDANEAGTPPPPPNPRFTVFPEWERFDGYDWPDGATVIITVQYRPECATEGVSSDNFFNGGFPEGCDVVVDDVVAFTDGETIRTHTVQNIAITAVDKEANTVTGTADEGAVVYAWVHEYGYDMQLPVENGTWLADFGSVGLNLVENMGGRAEVRDEFGNGTAVDWWIPVPVIFAHPAYELIEGADWKPGADVTVTVDDPTNGVEVDYSDTQVVGNDKWLQFWLNDFDLQAGHIITMTDGQYTQMMVVSSLRVTGFNLDAHTVYGVGDRNSEFFIADNGMPVSVDNEGKWSATFDALLPGSWWTIIQQYQDGNEVRETFRAPAPDFYVTPEENEVFAAEWTPGQTLEVYVNGVLTASQTVPDVGSYYGPEVHFFFGG